jgi:hypothetical protein
VAAHPGKADTRSRGHPTESTARRSSSCGTPGIIAKTIMTPRHHPPCLTDTSKSRRSRSRATPAVDDARRIKIQDHHLAMILINRGGCTRGPAEEKRRLAATSSSCLALLVI